jgi:hypothetical protein
MEELLRYTKAIMFLQLYNTQRATAPDEGPTFRPEILLSDAGFSAKEIARFLNKSPGATAKAISRARAAGKRSPSDDLDEGGGVDNG